MASTQFHRKIQKVNRRLQSTYNYYNENDRLKKGHKVLDYAEITLKKIYGSDYKGIKYFVPRNATEKELEKIERGLDMILNSPYTTMGGRKKIERKTKGSIMEKFNISAKNADTMLDIFNSDIWEKVRELTDFGSGDAVDVVNDLLSEGKEKEYIIEELKSFVKNNNDESIREFFDNVLD